MVDAAPMWALVSLAGETICGASRGRTHHTNPASNLSGPSFPTPTIDFLACKKKSKLRHISPTSKTKDRLNRAAHVPLHLPDRSEEYVGMELTKASNKTAEEDQYVIKPEAKTPTLDTSNWPLLLKNYDRCGRSAISSPGIVF